MSTLLISVGGSPEPVLKVILDRKPQKIIFFVSADSRSQVETQILPALGYFPASGFVVTPNAEDVGQCTFELLREVPREMRKLGESAVWPCLCGYTGGTKAMSASMVWAASRYPCELIYVGGGQRTRDGLGVVETGSERLVCIENPWDQVGWFETHKSFELVNRGQYENAASTIETILGKVQNVELRGLLSTVRNGFEALALWDTFNLSTAKQAVSRAESEFIQRASLIKTHLPELADWVRWWSEARIRIEAFQIPKKIEELPLTRTLIEDLIANALRRARLEKKYEDATARLYSAYEKEAKRLLFEYGINNSHCTKEQIPERLRTEFEGCFKRQTQTYRFGLDLSYILLNELENPSGKRFVENREKILRVLGKRNASILGHGTQPIKKAEFEQLLETVLTHLEISENQLFQFPLIL